MKILINLTLLLNLFLLNSATCMLVPVDQLVPTSPTYGAVASTSYTCPAPIATQNHFAPTKCQAKQAQPKANINSLIIPNTFIQELFQENKINLSERWNNIIQESLTAQDLDNAFKKQILPEKFVNAIKELQNDLRGLLVNVPKSPQKTTIKQNFFKKIPKAIFSFIKNKFSKKPQIILNGQEIFNFLEHVKKNNNEICLRTKYLAITGIAPHQVTFFKSIEKLTSAFIDPEISLIPRLKNGDITIFDSLDKFEIIMEEQPKQNQDLETINLYKTICTINPFSKQLSCEISKKQELTPTFADLHRKELYKSFFPLTTILPEKTDLSNLNNIINQIISKEEFLDKDYYVFYHGQKLEFLLFQDLLENFYKFFKQKSFNDFIMLRIPTQNFNEFSSVKNFIEKYKKNQEIYQWGFDKHSNIQEKLLSVCPSIFNNALSDTASNPFNYFLESSNAFSIDHLELIQKIFIFFKIDKLFDKYKKNIEELINLLTHNFSAQTGLLLQIFIPKNILDSVAYKSLIYGMLKNNLEESSEYLDHYKKAIHSYDEDLESMQFRIVLNNDIMLNPNSGIKIFRYYTKTEIIEKYQKQLSEFLNKIFTDIQ